MDDASALGLGLLRAFDALYAERNLTRAAARVGTSQPSMSRMLGELRAVFHDVLFVRGPGGVVPTPRADELSPEVDAILARARALVAPQRFEPAELTRTFVIATSDLVEQHLVAGVVERLRGDAPGVDVTFRPLVGDARELLARGADLVVGPAPSMPPSAITQHLFEDTFLCAVRRDHPTVRRRLTLARYVELSHVQIAPRGTPGGPVDDALAARGLTRRVAVRTSSFLAAPVLVSRSDLVLTAPAGVLLAMARPFALRTFAPPLPLPGFKILQAWEPRVQDDPVHAWFRRLVAGVARAR